MPVVFSYHKSEFFFFFTWNLEVLLLEHVYSRFYNLQTVRIKETFRVYVSIFRICIRLCLPRRRRRRRRCCVLSLVYLFIGIKNTKNQVNIARQHKHTQILFSKFIFNENFFFVFFVSYTRIYNINILIYNLIWKINKIERCVCVCVCAIRRLYNFEII